MTAHLDVPSTPADRRSDPTATTIRVMIMEYASKYADALADYWIAEPGSSEEHATCGPRQGAQEAQALLAAAFACYVSSGKSPSEFIRSYYLEGADRDRAEILAKDLEARLAPAPPIQVEGAWIEPGHEED